MMEKDLEWNKQQDLDDENPKKKPTTSNFTTKQIHFTATVHYFWNVVKGKMGIDEKSNPFKN